MESFVLHESETFSNHAMEAEEPHDAMKRVLTDVDLLSLIFSALGGADEMLAAAKVAKSWAMVSRDERVWLAFYLKRWGAHMMAEPPLLDLREGDTGVFCGLRNRPDLNGKLIKLGLWLENEGRWVVNVYSRMSIPECLFMSTGMNTIKARPQNLTGTWRMRYLRRLEAASVKVEFGTAVAQVKCMGSSEKTPQNPFISFSLCGEFVLGCGVLRSFSEDGSHQICRQINVDSFMPSGDMIAYYEVCVTGSSVGLTHGDNYHPSRRPSSNHCHIGWCETAYGYHSDDGSKWRNDKVGRPAVVFDTATDTEMIQGEVFAEPFGNCAAKPDVIGCGIDFKRRSIFFTKNGQLMGTAFEDVDVDPGGVGLAYGAFGLLPTVTLHERGDECRFNFGSQPFLFDVLAFGRGEARHAGVVGGGQAGIVGGRPPTAPS